MSRDKVTVEVSWNILNKQLFFFSTKLAVLISPYKMLHFSVLMKILSGSPFGSVKGWEGFIACKAGRCSGMWKNQIPVPSRTRSALVLWKSHLPAPDEGDGAGTWTPRSISFMAATRGNREISLRFGKQGIANVFLEGKSKQRNKKKQCCKNSCET